MRLPKFWRDSGTWNDPVVSAGVVAGWVAGAGLGWWFESPRLIGGGLVLGSVGGWLLGVVAVVILCQFFTAPGGSGTGLPPARAEPVAAPDPARDRGSGRS